jgi:DNA-binding transcriptional LysR family regulator
MRSLQLDTWRGIELRHLAALQAVAEERSFARAAARLGYTQSAVSQQIAALERIVEVELVERRSSRPGARLTEAGRILLEHAEATMARLTEAQADLAALAAGHGMLRVGAYGSVRAKILPPILATFMATSRSTKVALTETFDDVELFRRLRRGELDLVFADSPLPDGPFVGDDVLEDDIVLVVPAQSPQGRSGAPVAPEQLRGLPIVTFSAGRAIDRTRALLEGRGIQLEIVFQADDHSLLQRLIALGVGGGLMPRLTVDERDEGVRILDFQPRLAPRRIALARLDNPKGLSPTAARFAEAARRFCREYRATGVRGLGDASSLVAKSA